MLLRWVAKHNLAKYSFLSFWCLAIFLVYQSVNGTWDASYVLRKQNGHIDEKIGAWVIHLCPRYRATEDHSRYHKISWEPPAEDTIYFTRTSCQEILSAREACSVESAALHHPTRTVQVFLIVPTIDLDHPLMKTLKELPKVKFSWLDLDVLFSEEPLRSWHEGRMWMLSERLSSAYISDATRTTLLSRFGGTYVDLDAITLRAFPNTTNWLARLDERRISLAVATFQPGHKLLGILADAIPKVFNSKESDSIGPALLTNTLHHMCPENITIPDFTGPDTPEYCEDITIYQRNAFYPMSYEKQGLLNMFSVRKGLGKKFFTEHSEAYSLHLYNSLTSFGQIEMGMDSVLEEVARRNCPQIYDTVIKHGLIL